MDTENTVNNSVRPAKNGGTFITGNPGNAGGTGRPRSEIRSRLKGSFEQRIPILEEIADNKELSPRDRIAAIDKMATYSIGAKQEIEVTGDVQQALIAGIDAFADWLTDNSIDPTAELISDFRKRFESKLGG